MKTRRKRLLSLLLSACMVLTMLPAVTLPALAEGEHDHNGGDWHAITMGGKYIKIDGAEQSSNSLTLDGGNYYLAEDITINSDLNIKTDNEITLCLNNHTLLCSDWKALRFQNATSGNKAKVTINGEGGKIQGKSSGLVYVSDCDLTLNDVVIENTNTDEASMSNSCTLYISGSSSTCIMNDGSISTGSKMDSYSGYYKAAAVYVSGGYFTMNSGTITATGETSFGVYVANGDASFTMKGGSVSATGTGGVGVWLRNVNTFTMAGGTVTGDAYGVYVNDSQGKLDMSGGEIKGTGTTGSGVYSNGTVTLIDGAIIGVVDGIAGYGNAAISGGSSVTGASGYAIRHGSPSHSWNAEITLTGAPTLNGYIQDIHGCYGPYWSKSVGTLIHGGSYTGNTLTVDCEAATGGFTLIDGLNENNKDKFQFVADSKIVAEYKDGAYVTSGAPQTLTWYDINGNDITGQLDQTTSGSAFESNWNYYWSTWPYGEKMNSSKIPQAPVVPGKIFYSWAYKIGEDGEWTNGDRNMSRYAWSEDIPVTDSISFKPVYIDVFSGSGTENDPYLLQTARDLDNLAMLTTYQQCYVEQTKNISHSGWSKFNVGYIWDAFNNSDIYYKVTQNIDLSAICNENEDYYDDWVSIGCRTYQVDDIGGSWATSVPSAAQGYSFMANFDGGGFEIQNLYYTTGRQADKGLFGAVGEYGGGKPTTLQNIKLTNVYIEDSDDTDSARDPAWGGVLAGEVYPNVIIKNCTVTGILKTYAVPTPAAEAASNGMFGLVNELHRDVTLTNIDKSGLSIQLMDDAGTEPNVFAATLESDGHGTVSSDLSFAPKGTHINIVARPNAGYEFKEWKVVSGSPNISGLNQAVNSFLMPAGNVTLKAIFEYTGQTPLVTYTVTVQNDGNGNAFANITSAEQGTTVTLTATPNTGYKFKEWQVVNGSVTIKDNKFTMPAGDVTVKAVFEKVTPVTVTGITAKDKIYDGKTDADLDISNYKLTLEGGTEVSGLSLSIGTATAAFADANVGKNKTVTVTGSFVLTGTDADKYTLVQPSGLTANITTCTTVVDTTNKTQQVALGVGQFDGPHFIGVNGEAATGDVTYSCGTVNNGTADAVKSYLATLAANETAAINYTFTGTGNYAGASVNGTINITIVPLSFSISVNGRDETVNGGNAMTLKENPTYGDTWAEIVTIKDGIVAKSGDNICTNGTYTLNVTGKPDAGDNQTFKVLFSGTVGQKLYENVEVCNGHVNIAKKELTVKPADVSVSVGAAVPELKLDFVGLVAGDTQEPAETPAFEVRKSDNTVIALAEAVKIAGTYTIEWTNADAANLTNDNYNITLQTTGTLTVRTAGGDGGGGISSYSITVEPAENGEVTADRKSASYGSTVTITVEPDKGYDLESLTVIDRNGKEVKLTEKTGKYTFTMPASGVTVKATFTEDHFFTDVPADAYFHDAVLWATKQGITNGTSNTTFNPGATCTRAQAVTFLWRAAGSPDHKSSEMPFSDVPANAFYHDAVLWAVEQGITVGTSATTFSPNADCNRAQIVAFLWRAEKSPAVETANPFTDVAEDAFFADAVVWAVENGITVGTGNDKFSPFASCTRAQIVTFLWRSMNK